jgi:hypothetical protein
MKSIKSGLALICFTLLFTASCSTGEVLYTDDFSDAESGWDIYNGDAGISEYLNGSYLINVKEPQFDRWALAHQEFENVSVQVDATKINGTDDNNYGIICNYMGLDQFYMFLISSDGYYMIQKKTAEGIYYLSGEWFEESEQIKTGDETNTIRAVCGEGKLSLFINNKLVDEVMDSEYTKGDVGLMAGTFNVGNVNISFDNFIVKKIE